MRNLGVAGQARYFSILLVLMLIGIPLVLGGCERQLGYAGSHPGGFYCSGEGSVSFYGAAAAAAAFGGSEMNGGGIQAKCPTPGFYFYQGTPEQLQKLQEPASAKQ